MIKFNFKIGTKISFVMVSFVVLAISMAIGGRIIINKFQLASSSHIPTINYYEGFLNGSKIELFKYVNTNMYSDTLKIDKSAFDFQNLLIFHWVINMKERFKLHQEVEFDYKVVQKSVIEYVINANKSCDLITELTYMRRSNHKTLKKIYSLTNNGSYAKVSNDIHKIVEMGNGMEMSQNFSLFNSIEENFTRIKSIIPEKGETELLSQINLYEKGLIRTKELFEKINGQVNAAESSWSSAYWEYASGKKAAILLAMDDMVKNINLYYNVIILIILVIGFIFTYSIVTSINYGVKENYDVIESISNGNLNVDIKDDILNRTDEFGRLSNILQKMIGSQKSVISQIKISAREVQLSANQLKNSSVHITSEANIQASSLEEISSSMEEMVSNIMQNSTNADEARKKVEALSAKINIVNEESLKSIDAIKKITNKISFINDIAFQTNLLALNAAVEAARVGESGKGFAVVAAEVKKLAERSRTVADEINVISRQSMEVTINSSSLLSELLPDIKNATLIVQEIASASIEQQAGSEHINTAIQQLNQITQQYASTSGELFEKSEILQQMSNDLNEQISNFKV